MRELGRNIVNLFQQAVAACQTAIKCVCGACSKTFSWLIGQLLRIFSPVGVALWSYCKIRKTTVFIFFVTLAALVFVSYSLYNLTRRDEPYTTVMLMGDRKDYVLTGSSYFLEHRGNGNDELMIELDFDAISENMNGKRFVLALPKHLRLDNSKSFSGSAELVSVFPSLFKGGTDYVYEFTKPERATIWAVFHGDLFGDTADVALHLNVIPMEVNKRDTVSALVSIKGLEHISVGSIFPEPTERRPQGLFYKHITFGGEDDQGPLSLYGTDRTLSSGSQFKILWFSILAGILASIIASVVLEVIHHLEDERKKEREKQALDSEMNSNGVSP